MTDTPVRPLRRRMIEDMTIRKLAPKTQASYIRAVRNFTAFLGRSPDQASAEDLRHYQLHLAAGGAAPISAQPKADRSKLDEGEVIGGELVIAGGDTPALLNLVEEPLHKV